MGHWDNDHFHFIFDTLTFILFIVFLNIPRCIRDAFDADDNCTNQSGRLIDDILLQIFHKRDRPTSGRERKGNLNEIRMKTKTRYPSSLLAIRNVHFKMWKVLHRWRCL